MKAYLIAPIVPDNLDQDAENDRLTECVEPIADYICDLIEKDPALFGVRSKDETTCSPLDTELRLDNFEAVAITSREMLKKILTASGDVNSGAWMAVRSLATCTSVSYGFDGQAFVVLPEDAKTIEPKPRNMFVVEESSKDIVGTNWFDQSLLIEGYTDFPDD